jgi:PAS domain-containing protein
MADSRRLQAKLLDHIPAAVVVSDARHRIVYCNHEARELYGCAEGGEVPFELAETAQHAGRWEGSSQSAATASFAVLHPSRTQPAGVWER